MKLAAFYEMYDKFIAFYIPRFYAGGVSVLIANTLYPLFYLVSCF